MRLFLKGIRLARGVSRKYVVAFCMNGCIGGEVATHFAEYFKIVMTILKVYNGNCNQEW